MHLKKTMLILLLIVAFGCGAENSENAALKAKIPEIEDISKKLDYKFTNGFYFTENIRVDKIGVLQLDEHRFKIFYFLSDRKNLEEVQLLNIAFRVYPKDPLQFKTVADQEAKARTIAAACHLKRMGDAFVISTDVFFMQPKTFKESKIYLYDPDSGVVGKTMTILDLKL